MVTGGPGMGKSALLAAWLARREAAGAVVPHHFIRRGEYDWDDPAKLVGSLVAQIEARFPDQREPDGDVRMHPAARLAAMLQRVSERELALRGERLVVLIDGLDEYDPPVGAPAGDPLAAFLPHALPRGVSFVCASRPRHPYVSSLEARDGGLVRIDLDDPSSAADNDATVRRFWEQAAPPLGLDARFIDAAVASAGGNVQHAVTLQKHLAGLPSEQRRALAIPRGLAALLERSWERVATDPAVVCGLGILCAAREALTLDELGAVAGWIDNAQRRAFLRGAKELLVETRRPDGLTEYRLHHDSIRSYIAAEIGTAALRGHHAVLAQRLATWPAPVEPTARRYAVRHALLHRAEAGEWADAWRLAADTSFLEAKCRELGAHEAEADVARAAERCRASGDEALRGRFDDLARALGRESHWLRAAPEATAALVWNRLRRSGWSTDELDQQLQVPAEATFLRLRHVATCESSAFVRDLVGHVAGVQACAVTPDGQRVVSASWDNTLQVWDLDSGRSLATLRGHSAYVSACAVTMGWHAVSASADRTLKVWDLNSGSILATLQGHSAPVLACAVTPDGQRVISASADHTLKIWDTGSGRNLITLQGHSAWVLACTVTPNGRCVVSASADKTLKVWDTGSGRLLATLQGHSAWVSACAVTPDGRRVLSASHDQTLKIWDLDSGHLATLQGHSAPVLACAVTPDGCHVVSASEDKTLKVWSLDSGYILATLQGHSSWVSACAATPDGRRVVSASADNTVKVWDLDTGRALAILQCGSPVNACTVTPDGRCVVLASTDRTLQVRDLDTGRPLVTMQGHSGAVLSCAMTPDGRRVISASDDSTLEVWDLDTGRSLATVRGHSAVVRACAVTPDGRRVISASYDQTLKVWDLDSGALLATLQGHAAGVLACAVAPDGRSVVSASEDQTLKVWDLESGRTLATLHGHVSWVGACAVTPDGRSVVSASDDKTLKVWDLDSYACILTHRGNAAYTAVAVTGAAVIAGDATGAVWFLDWPASRTAR